MHAPASTNACGTDEGDLRAPETRPVRMSRPAAEPAITRTSTPAPSMSTENRAALTLFARSCSNEAELIAKHLRRLSCSRASIRARPRSHRAAVYTRTPTRESARRHHGEPGGVAAVPRTSSRGARQRDKPPEPVVRRCARRAASHPDVEETCRDARVGARRSRSHERARDATAARSSTTPCERCDRDHNRVRVPTLRSLRDRRVPLERGNEPSGRVLRSGGHEFRERPAAPPPASAARPSIKRASTGACSPQARRRDVHQDRPDVPDLGEPQCRGLGHATEPAGPQEGVYVIPRPHWFASESRVELLHAIQRDPFRRFGEVRRHEVVPRPALGLRSARSAARASLTSAPTNPPPRPIGNLTWVVVPSGDAP